MQPNLFSSPTLVVSLVSHGHGDQVSRLLMELAREGGKAISRVVLTQNIPEAAPAPPSEQWPFLLEIRRNSRPEGFGRNHNRALSNACEAFVCVLNPDVGLMGAGVFAVLAEIAAQPGVGCSYPMQVDEQGVVQDSERELPGPQALWRRRVLRLPETRVDWVNAACLVLPRGVWQALGGFDEGYFMYCEDVDLCLRLRRAGWSIRRAPVSVVHTGQRASFRRWDHLRWHVASLLRLWRSPAYRWASECLQGGNIGTGNISNS